MRYWQMLSEQPESQLDMCLACTILQPALRSLLIFDAPFIGLQQIAQHMVEMAAQVGQKLRSVVIGSTEYDDDLWGKSMLPGGHGDIEVHARIFAPPRASDETLLIIIPDLSALSLAAARACIMLVGASVAHLERHGQQGVWLPRYYWLAGCRQEAVGAVSPHLLDRFALRLSWASTENRSLSHQERVSVLQSNLRQTHSESLLPLDADFIQSIKQAAKDVAPIEITEEACKLIMSYQEGEVFHQRRELALARCAVVLAQLAHDSQLLASHVEQAAQLMGLQAQDVSEDVDAPIDVERQNALPIPHDDSTAPMPVPQLQAGDTVQQPGASSQNIAVQTQEPAEQRTIDYVVTAANPYPEDTEPILREAASLQIPPQHAAKMRSDRGPIIGVEPGTSLRDLALVNTLMRALLFQAFRPRQHSAHIVLDWTDLRTYRRAAEPERLLLLLLDYTSLPLAQRQRELVPYLSQAYIERAGITIIKVGAVTNETRSNLRAESVSARSILVPAISDAIDAPAGNATPLAHGLELALQIIQRALQHGRSAVQQVTFVVVSDGRGNVPLQASYSNMITPPIAREGVEDALEQACAVGKIKHVSSFIISPRLRYYADLPQHLADALHAQLIISEDGKGGQI